MSSPDEHNMALFPKPIELKLADVLFFAMRKNLMLFKDLGKEHIHYSVFIRGSLIDFHETLEDQDRHIPLAKIEFDWKFLMERVSLEITANRVSIFQTVKINDPEWEDLEVAFIPAKELMELLSPIIKGARWNVDAEFLEKLKRTVSSARLGELADRGVIIGTAEGYLVFGNGTDCFLFDMDKMSKIIEKSFELSINEIHLSRFTLRTMLFSLKIRLVKLVYSIANYLRRL